MAESDQQSWLFIVLGCLPCQASTNSVSIRQNRNSPQSESSPTRNLDHPHQHNHLVYHNSSQSCRMSIFLHGAKPSSQILPEEKHVNRDHFGTKIDKGGTFGEQMLMFLSNYESLDRDISHRLCKSPPKKASFFKIVCSPKLLPQLANIFTRINPSYP